MKAARLSCVAVLVGAALGFLAATASGMTPTGLQAYGETYAAIANTYSVGEPTAMTETGLRAYGDTYQSMAVSYLAEQQSRGIPVQWHDVFTGVGVTAGAFVLLGAVGLVVVRTHRHAQTGRYTLAH